MEATGELKQDWFKKIISYLKKDKLSKLEDESQLNRESYIRNFQNIGEWKFSEENLTSKQDFMNKITNDGKELRRMGVEDGKQGLNPSAMRTITKNIASLWQSFIEKSFQSKLAQSQEEEISAKEQCEKLKNEHQSLLDHKKVIDTHYKYNSKDYNSFLGWLYIMIAITLVIADFPLSIQTVNEGFLIDTEFESFLLAIGIVSMTIYIKILYDEYIGNSIQKTILNTRAKNILGEGNEATKEEFELAKKIKKRQTVVKLFILVLLLFTITFLGLFRYDSIQINLNGNEQLNEYGELAKSSVAKFTFILITLIFPIIGGVCASLGSKHLGNKKERRKTISRLKKIQTEKEDSLKILLKIKGEIKDSEGHLEWVKKKSSSVEEGNCFLSEYSSYFFSCYLHGYDKGIHEDLSSDLYYSAINIRNKAVASATFKILNP